jgi:hypothetical protein
MMIHSDYKLNLDSIEIAFSHIYLFIFVFLVRTKKARSGVLTNGWSLRENNFS